MKRWLAIVVMAACSSKQGGTSNGSQGGTAAPPVVAQAKTCDDVKPRVEQLYRTEATAKEPKRVDEAVADNTAMVMADCAKDPAKFVPCLASVPTVGDLERDCMIPLDEEGTEAEARK